MTSILNATVSEMHSNVKRERDKGIEGEGESKKERE